MLIWDTLFFIGSGWSWAAGTFRLRVEGIRCVFFDDQLEGRVEKFTGQGNYFFKDSL